MRFLQWRDQYWDLPDDNNAYDELFNEAMAHYGVTQADVDWCESGNWTIRTRNEVDHRAYSLDFIGNHCLQWHW